MSARTADCPKCGALSSVILTAGPPRCVKCKARWLAAIDFKRAVEAAKTTKTEYLAGPLQTELGLLVDIVRVTTMGEIKQYLADARVQLGDRLVQTPDGSENFYRVDEAVRALDAIIAWLEKMQTKVGAKDKEKKDGD